MRRADFQRILVLGVLSLLAVGAAPDRAKGYEARATVDDLLALEVRPIAIGHRGFGENLGEDPSRPIENTLSAVRQGLRAGVSVVEVDVQRTADGEIVAYHDDFLSDFTCIHRLTLGQLRARMPQVATLHAILLQARSFERPRELRGLVIVELKAPSPLCDPKDTQEYALVSSVAAVIRRAGMTHQVILTSFSPVLLLHAQALIPETTRSLTVDVLQFLSPEDVRSALNNRFGGLSFTLIDKRRDLGLQWAEIGSLLRLPSYWPVENGSTMEAIEKFTEAIGKLIATADTVDARIVEADLVLLGLAGPLVVGALHGAGLEIFGYAVDNEAEWQLLAALGVDAIYTNDIPLGVELQASIPALEEPHGHLASLRDRHHERLFAGHRR
jgi:glycerophosphoryl diester phosphodiesterase